jgi:hypothetical protein
MGALAQVGNNPAGQNFLIWVVNVGGIPLLVALLAAIGLVHWFLWWLCRWHMRLGAGAFPAARSDFIRGIIAGIALAILWLMADFLILWQRQVPFWGRQAWETRCIMMGMSLLLGATVGTKVFQVRRFKRTLAG